MGRFIFRVIPLFVVCCGAIVADLGWIPYLLGWAKTPYSPLHSMDLVLILLVLGFPLGVRLFVDSILRRKNED